ncbi:solute carrier family 26 member 6-like isoform X1 [Neodiprion virginianus]|uniref:Solute carrier family 26 member 6 isoform X2 n=1 Tax=Neodiprion lecontei TaxID=441921 RepID=A0A6J0BJB6_NEOLC|nr:solute carrier family 26 member 6 isoform X2 [Neodiprion lecontei]XP_046616725.1 solute carrier family 26 member 6-like isoform X1 [Neodiprion virginianus]
MYGSMDKEDEVLRHLQVERPLYEQDALNKAYHYEKPKHSFVRNTKKSLKSKSCGSCTTSTIPALNWLRSYEWKKDICSDLISGLTVAIMHIPQGMAYALLGNVPPVVGIYMAFFPVLVYFFLGTSKHVSMGTFAVVCLMTGKAVTTHATFPDVLAQSNVTDPTLSPDVPVATYTPIEVATTVTFMVGILQLGMYLFRLGIISTLLSETLVNGFTTGAAVWVLISQIKDLLGLQLPKQKSMFKLIFSCIDIFNELPNVNIAAAIISTVAIIIMVFNNEIIKPYIAKKCSIPIPIELVAVVTGTLISNYGNLPEVYNIRTVGDIPTGLPIPKPPSFSLLPAIAFESVAITMVSYTITMSMALIFAQKLNYEVDSNQELLAMGSSNIVGSFFSCMPVTASLSRSLIQQTTGGKSQLASIVSCGILLTILLWIGPFFEPLPRCVLASIIVVALKGMLLQACELKKFWKLSKLDAAVWIVTFLVVVLVNIDIGLVVGLLVSLTSIFVQSIRPYTCLLGHIPNTDLYLDLKRFKGTTELCGIKIFHYCGGLNFANSGHLKSELFKLVGVVPREVVEERRKLTKKGLYPDPLGSEDKEALRCIILDLSAMSYIDPSGINTLRFLTTEFEKIEVPVYLAGCSGPVFEQIVKCDQFQNKEPSFRIFVGVHDAVTFIQHELFK